PEEQDELNAHATEGMSVAVVLNATARRNRFGADLVGKRQPFTRTRSAGFFTGVLPRIELLDAAEQVAQPLFLFLRHGALVELSQRFLNDLAPARTTEHLLANCFHYMTGEDSFEHAPLHAVGWIVQHRDCRL